MFLTSFGKPRHAWLVAALPLLAACSDREPLLPDVPAPDVPMAAAQCRVDVQAETMACTPLQTPSSAARGTKILGGQEIYVRLTSSGTSYDSATNVLSTNVTVQNLLQQTMGVDSTATILGVKVFFHQDPTVTGGSGAVTIANPDGADSTFTAANQKFFHYNQAITPFEVSSARNWRFNVPLSATTFTFSVYVSAPLASNTGTLEDRVWAGGTNGSWSNGANWKHGAAPDSGSTVHVPPDALISGTHSAPTLDTDGVLSHLRVGSGSSVALNGHTLTAWGNVDAVGALTGGTLRMRGGSALLGGNVSAVQVSGGVQLQKATAASGSVSVQDGALTVKDQTLTISVP